MNFTYYIFDNKCMFEKYFQLQISHYQLSRWIHSYFFLWLRVVLIEHDVRV